jgi:hypothetical protein
VCWWSVRKIYDVQDDFQVGNQSLGALMFIINFASKQIIISTLSLPITRAQCS